MFSINFVHRGTIHSLQAGKLFATPRDVGFRDAPAEDLVAIISEIDAGRPWRQVVHDRYAATNPWLHRIITDKSRTLFFEAVLPPGDGLTLDLGSGWGQTARPLASHRPVVALEPVAERLAFIQAAARQDGVDRNLSFVGADYFDVQFETKFSTICAIGVFEWVGAFQSHTDPQERQRAFLCKARNDLAPGGSLVLGIENRLGLKYLLGCPDDHLGVLQIACLPATLARQRWQESRKQALQSFTYSLAELEQMLRKAGFTSVELFSAFPDYKLPEKIIPLSDGGHALNSWLATGPLPPEHNGYDGTVLPQAFQADLQARYRSLASTGSAQHFVPSFFVRAS